MKEKEESLFHKLSRKALEKEIRRTSSCWPPYSTYGFYQPHRPEKPLLNTKNEGV